MEIPFEWDSFKGRMNLAKHDVSFEEASTVFSDTLSITIADPLHSADEERSLIVGMSQRKRLLVVAFAMRNNQFRIIGARPATHSERNAYEEIGP